MQVLSHPPSGAPALVLNADFRPLSYYPLSLWPWQEVIKAVFLDRVDGPRRAATTRLALPVPGSPWPRRSGPGADRRDDRDGERRPRTLRRTLWRHLIGVKLILTAIRWRHILAAFK